MIPDRNRDQIQAEAYRELANMIARSLPGCVPMNVHQLIERTERKITAKVFDVQDVMHRLWISRRHRLPNVDFAYWPASQHPRILRQNGTHSYLPEKYFMETLSLDNQLLSKLEHAEHSLFHADHHTAVYWRSSFPIGIWEVLQSQELNRLTFGLRYCVAHFYDGEVHEEAKKDRIGFHLNLNTHHPDGSVRPTNLIFPKR